MSSCTRPPCRAASVVHAGGKDDDVEAGSGGGDGDGTEVGTGERARHHWVHIRARPHATLRRSVVLHFTLVTLFEVAHLVVSFMLFAPGKQTCDEERTVRVVVWLLAEPVTLLLRLLLLLHANRTVNRAFDDGLRDAMSKDILREDHRSRFKEHKCNVLCFNGEDRTGRLNIASEFCGVVLCVLVPAFIIFLALTVLFMVYVYVIGVWEALGFMCVARTIPPLTAVFAFLTAIVVIVKRGVYVFASMRAFETIYENIETRHYREVVRR